VTCEIYLLQALWVECFLSLPSSGSRRKGHPVRWQNVFKLQLVLFKLTFCSKRKVWYKMLARNSNSECWCWISHPEFMTNFIPQPLGCCWAWVSLWFPQLNRVLVVYLISFFLSFLTFSSFLSNWIIFFHRILCACIPGKTCLLP